MGALARARDYAAPARSFRLQRFEILDEVGLLLRSQLQVLGRIIAVHHLLQRCRAAIVEVGRVLPKAPKRGGAVQFRGAPLGVLGIGGDLRRRMKPSLCVSKAGAEMAGGAL